MLEGWFGNTSDWSDEDCDRIFFFYRSAKFPIEPFSLFILLTESTIDHKVKELIDCFESVG